MLLDAGANTEAKDKVRGEWEGTGGEMGSGGVRGTYGVVCCFKFFFLLGRKTGESTMLIDQFMSADCSRNVGLRRPFPDLEMEPFCR